MINLILNVWNKQNFCAGKLKSIVAGDWSRRIDFIRTKMQLPMQHFIKFGLSFEALVFRDRFSHGKRILQFRDEFQIFLTFSFCGFSVSINPFSFDHVCQCVNRQPNATLESHLKSNHFSIEFIFHLFQLQHHYYRHQHFNICIHNLTFDMFNVWFHSVSEQYEDCQSS